MSSLKLEEPPPTSTTSQEGGFRFWSISLDTVDDKRGELAYRSNAAMSSIMIVAGLFASSVSVFVVNGPNSLLPDSSAQAGNLALARTNALLAQLLVSNITSAVSDFEIESFHPTEIDVAVNILWSFALVLSLFCAILATLAQSWLSDPMRKGPPVTAALEEHAFGRLRELVAIRRYGLDHTEGVVVGLLHSAVIVFLIGLAIHFSTINTTLAVAVAVLCVGVALFYIVASFIPLFDSDCPSYTPLSYLIRAAALSLVTILSCIVLYAICVCYAVRGWISNKHIDLRDISLRRIVVFLMHPSQSAQLLQDMVASLMRGSPATEREELIKNHFGKLSHHGPFTARELINVATLAWPSLLSTPDALWYMTRCLISMEQQGVSDFFAYLRNDRDIMANIAAVLDSVVTVPAAIGAVRFLQMLVSAEGSTERDSRRFTNGDWRWENMDAIFDVLSAFIKRVGALNAEALRQGDLTLHTAISSFRSSLIVAWGDIVGNPRTPEDLGFLARSKIRWLLTELHDTDGLRMCKVSSSDHDDLNVLFDSSVDPRLELAARSTLTYLKGVQECGWPPGWHKPDEPYLPKGYPEMWAWRRMFAPKHLWQPPPASDCLRELLDQEYAKLSAHACPSADITSMPLDAVALNVLNDLSSIVDCRAPSQSNSFAEHSSVEHSFAEHSTLSTPPQAYFDRRSCNGSAK
ncbi:unnamed protein product [Peniophora sp. CBMAI 1063]|nr:unnamed protein product [Peniophora sp. CBMAI 1063]